MLQLFDITHKKIAGLTNYKDYNIQREINQLDILSFLYPVIDINSSALKEEYYIRTKENEYVIKEVNTQDDDWTQYVCKVNIEGIQGTPVSHFETVEQLCSDSVNLALAGTGWTVGSCNVTKRRTVRKNNCNAYDVLKEIQNAYGCEMTFDAVNRKVNIYQVMGTDKGTYFAEQLNLKKLTVQRNSYNYITRLIPIGKDGLQINDINGGKEYVENKQYSNKIITAYWEDNRYTVVEALLEDATAKLDYLSKPYKAYKADVFDLANANDKYKNILDYGLGDTITLMAKSKNTKEKQRIIKIVEYPDEPERNTCDIANKIASLDVLNARFQNTSDTVDNVTTSDGGLDGSKVDGIDWNKVQNVHIMVADIQDMSVVTARIGTLEATSATITQLNAVQANINDLTANKANVTDLTAATGRITLLESSTASINTLLAGNIGVANLQAGLITATSGLIANGAILDAMIQNLSVSKILAGDISTTKFRIVSDSGKMLLSDNTMQISDGTRVRVQIGKDASNDYNMYVWDASGNLMFDALGLKASGIKDKIIRDDMVSDTANIDAKKLNITSLFTQMNGSTQTLKASKIYLDTEAQTLDVQFTSLKSTVTSQGSTITSQGTSISTLQGQITSKIWSTDITTAVNNIQVGGTNLLRNADFKSLSYWSGYDATTANDYQNKASLTLTRTNYISGNPRKQIASSLLQFPLLTTGSAYTISAWVYIDSSVALDASISNNLTLRVYDSVSYVDYGNIDLALLSKNTWVYIYKSFVLTKDAVVTTTKPMLLLSISQNGLVKICMPKLEIGNKATAFTVAPEDVQSQIDTTNSNLSSLTTRVSTTESSITQLNNSIVLKVDTTTYTTGLATKEGTITKSVAAPVSPTNGQLWLDTSATPNVLKKYNGTSWDKATPTTASEVGAYSSSQGSTLEGRMTTAESNITLNTNNIALKVATTDFNTYKTSNDSAVTTAQNTANVKRRVFTAQPTVPYDIGDLWISTTTSGDNMICTTARSTGAYTASDWVKDSITQRISSAEASITVNANNIALKVNTTDFNTLTGRVSATESNISVLQGQITSKVNTADFGTLITQNTSSVKVAVGQIGGNNFIKNSGFLTGAWGSPTTAYLQSYDFSVRNSLNTASGKEWHWWATQGGGGAADASFSQDFDTVLPAGHYTFSFYNQLITGNFTVTLSIWDNTTNWGLNVQKDFTSPNGRTSYTFNLGVTCTHVRITFHGSNWVGLNAEAIQTNFGDLKLEAGDNATAWSQNSNELKNSSFEVTDVHARFTSSDGSYTEFVPGSTGLTWHKASTSHDYHYLSYGGYATVTLGADTIIQLPDEFKGKDFKILTSVKSTLNDTAFSTIVNVGAFGAVESQANGTIRVSGLCSIMTVDTAGNYVNINLYKSLQVTYLVIA